MFILLIILVSGTVVMKKVRACVSVPGRWPPLKGAEPHHMERADQRPRVAP
jgi:hypothetical protein